MLLELERGAARLGAPEMLRVVQMSEKPDENRPLTDDQIVIATELHKLTEKPLKVAKLVLHTLEGSQAFGINEETAEGLVDMLERFLGKRPP
jgi:hypothetical protein